MEHIVNICGLWRFRCAQRKRENVTKDDKEIAPALHQALAERVGKERFELWFADGTRLSHSDGEVIVWAAEQFTLDRLRKHFRADIEAACRQVFAGDMEVRFRVDALLSSKVTVSNITEAGTTVPTCESVPIRKASLPNEQSPAVGGSNRRRFSNLEQYVVGEGNKLAFTAAQMSIGRLGEVSPLMVYGPTGCGKTHLLEGIWTAVRRTGKLRRTVMLSAEQFTSYFLAALRGSGLPNFRRKYRDVDLLLIDDVQFFAGKRATLVELQHTIDTLLRGGRQLVLAADRPPAEMNGLGSELTARMSGGLVCAIQPHDAATRYEIARRMAQQRDFSIPEKVLQLIADRLTGDARLLSGALNRLQATSQAMQQPITFAVAEQALSDMLLTSRPPVRMGDIERAVCEVFGLEPKTLQSDRKSKAVSHPRMLAMWLARKYTRAAYSEIGRYFGRRSHSTVISAQNKIDRLIGDSQTIHMAHGDCRLEEAVRRVESQLRTG